MAKDILLKFSLNVGSKTVKIDEVEKCDLFRAVRGLMFKRRENAKALLLFDLHKPRRLKIHSFFVFFPFLVLWLDNNNKILEWRIVKSWKPLILPKKKFSKLLEIPCNAKYQHTIKIIVGCRKI